VICKCSHTSGDGNKDGEALSRISRVLYDKQKYTLEEFFSDIKTFKDFFIQMGGIFNKRLTQLIPFNVGV